MEEHSSAELSVSMIRPAPTGGLIPRG